MKLLDFIQLTYNNITTNLYTWLQTTYNKNNFNFDSSSQYVQIINTNTSFFKNNLWVVVPCHRVIGSDGSLTGYAGGLWRKKWLLAHEAKVLGVGQTVLAL